MAARGYDVWLGNTRGSQYSRDHLTLSPDDPRFWDFSFSLIGPNDISATIDYVLLETGFSQVNYVGHSEGTSSFLAVLSLKSAYNSKINIATLMAPIAFEKYIRIDESLFFQVFGLLWV